MMDSMDDIARQLIDLRVPIGLAALIVFAVTMAIMARRIFKDR